MDNDQVIDILKKKYLFTEIGINKLKEFSRQLLIYNSRYNLISKSTEKSLWNRHILDSAQLITYINFSIQGGIADLGSGAGFPGLVIALYNSNPKFHVKLYEKSPVKREFLVYMINKVGINAVVRENVYSEKISSNYIVCRAFKKLKEIIKISRENALKPHKLIILKGKNAQEEINNVSLESNYKYKLEKSITDDDSKIIIIEAE
jgi:16S rRNA (guanine527-N7)-methyltransferase|tara:strand:+ start:1905 stop:2519 length:615 start_codon:yes stop_codon:yes gene_type:complete